MAWRTAESRSDGRRRHGCSTSASASWTRHVEEAILLVKSAATESSLTTTNSFASPSPCLPTSRADLFDTVVVALSLAFTHILLGLVIAGWLA